MTSRLAPVLPSTIVTVTVPGDFAGAEGGTAAVVAGSLDSGWGGGLRHRDHLRRLFGDAQIRQRDRHRLAARTVFGRHRPQHKRTEEQAKRHHDDLRRRNLKRAPISPRTLSKRRCQVIHGQARFRSGFVQIPDPARCAIRESRRRAYHGLSAAGRSAGGGLAQTTKNRGGTWPPRSLAS
jgi:hypothetical protein